MGGGIPAGVVLGHQRGLAWPLMAFLYFCSDLVLAVVFEPLMLGFLRVSRDRPGAARVKEVLRKAMGPQLSRLGLRPGPFTLVLLTFGTDPMTGRALAKVAGHGFFTGWAITIAGDMLYFLVVMASTLWLNHILGNGTLAVLIVMLVLLGGPALVRKLRERKNPNSTRLP